MLWLTFFLCREGKLDDIINGASEPNGLRPVEQAVGALHTKVYEDCGVDHGHLETTNSLTANSGYVLRRTLVVTLRREKKGMCMRERERKEKGGEMKGGGR